MDIESPERLNETKRGAFAAREDSNRVWIHRREGLKGKHRWNGLLIPAATAMVLLGMCDSATADTFGIQIAAGVAGHRVHKLENASVKEPNPASISASYICSTTSELRSSKDEGRGCSVA